ncbi:MAG TPA: sugar phosphate nucleotidyltransferase, partial [Bacillota bacterium]|nr:sugar phosphate nucleotidyltransferase [Bacillota bacterium]
YIGAKMRGILLAGGTGSRLFPLTRVIDQYLLPVGKYPMVFYPLERLKKAGIKQVLIVAGRETLGPLIGILGSGDSYGLELQYQVREKPAGFPITLPAGTLSGLELAADFVRQEPFLVVLGNQIFRDDLDQAVTAFKNQPVGARIFLKEVHDPKERAFEECAIAEFQSNQLFRVRPNHSNDTSNPCITGIYMFDAKVFDFISKIKHHSGKEPEITEVLDAFLARGELSFQALRDWWVEVETFETLELANEYAQGVELEFN